MIATFHYDSQCWLLTDPTEAACTCGHTYYVDQGCPRCAKTVPHPFLLRDQCGTCGLPCSADWCPYCEGCHEGEEATNAARRATEFAVKQQEMLTAQLAARDRIITSLQAVREDDLSEAATLRARIAELARQRDLARADYALASNRLKAAADRIIALEDLHTTARRWVARLTLGGVGLAGAGALGWLWWDALHPLAAYLPGSRTWAEVAVVLALVLVLRWPVTRVARSTGDQCGVAGLETPQPAEVTKPPALPSAPRIGAAVAWANGFPYAWEVLDERGLAARMERRVERNGAEFWDFTGFSDEERCHQIRRMAHDLIEDARRYMQKLPGAKPDTPVKSTG